MRKAIESRRAPSARPEERAVAAQSATRHVQYGVFSEEAPSRGVEHGRQKVHLEYTRGSRNIGS